MKEISVNINKQTYKVLVGNNILDSKDIYPFSNNNKVVLIADENAYAHYGEQVLSSITNLIDEKIAKILIKPGEASKSWNQVIEICDFLAAQNLSRNDYVLVLGGGVVGDLAGFVASIWMRGIKFVNIPTTLLAQVDASVGGKTGINLSSGKNLVGAFHQPSLVIADINTLTSLATKEYFAGFAEIIKHSILDQDIDNYLSEHFDKFINHPCSAQDELANLIAKNIAYKAQVVEADEKENSIRAHLNLGHTFAHALEKVLNYQNILHGEAVAIGLVAACNLANKINLANNDLQIKTQERLAKLNLPIRFPKVNLDELIAAMSVDKKNIDHQLRFVVPQDIGNITIKSDIPIETIKSVITELS